MSKKFHFLLTVSIMLAILLPACSEVRESRSDLERITEPNVLADDLNSLATGNTDFAFELYQNVHSSSENLVYSPYSISLAFAMAYGGARGTTESQMKDVLNYTLPVDQFHPAFNVLDLILSERAARAAEANEDERLELTIANSLWGQSGSSFLPEYLDLLAVNYGAGIRLVDFESSPESARRQINDWVSEKTKNRIENIIPKGAFDPEPRLVLANAIYFKAFWLHEFGTFPTSDSPFYLLNGETIDVPMMHQYVNSFRYVSGKSWQAIALPYKGDMAEMIIIVPDTGKFETFANALRADLYDSIINAMETHDVEISLPKFNYETNLGLKDALIQMGMSEAFDLNRADYSGMDDKNRLYISNAIHTSFISVDEKGTEAAAATVIIAPPASAYPDLITLTIDRPFFFAIRDKFTGTILFMGHVVNPNLN